MGKMGGDAHNAPPKVAIGPTKWSEGLYGTYDGCMAKPEVTQLAASKPPAHVLQSSPDLATAIQCMTETGDIGQCQSKFEDFQALKVQGGFKEEEKVAFTTKVKNTAYKAGAVKTVGAVTLAGMTLAGFT